MDLESRTIIVHDARYRDGAGILLAWDFRVACDSELATYLFRTPGEGYFVHSVSPAVESHEAVTPLETERARELYLQMPIHLLSAGEAFPD